MRVSHQTHWLYFLVAALLPLYAFAKASDDDLTYLEGRYFEIVGTDHRSVSFVNALGEHVIELCQSYLRAGRHDFPQRIYVALRPKERVNFDSEYQIEIGARGQVILDFRWGTALELETVCRAFTEAYIVRYANFNYGPGANKRLRFWAVSALSSQAYLTLRPAQKGQYVKEALEAGILELDSMLSLDWNSGRELVSSQREGYWVPYVLHRSGWGREDVGLLLYQAIAGGAVSEELEAAIQPVDGDQQPITLSVWWQNEMAGHLSQTFEYYESMDVSREWIESLADFDAYRASGGELGNLMQLWDHREDEALRAVLNARQKIIALRLERVNPAYFNAAQALGALYETSLQATRRFDFIHAFTAYLSDWEDTKRMHQQINQLFDASSGS